MDLDALLAEESVDSRRWTDTSSKPEILSVQIAGE